MLRTIGWARPAQNFKLNVCRLSTTLEFSVANYTSNVPTPYKASIGNTTTLTLLINDVLFSHFGDLLPPSVAETRGRNPT